MPRLKLADITNRTKGWQRLWIVLSLVFVGAVSYFAVIDAPGSKDCYLVIGESRCLMHECSAKELETAIRTVLPTLPAFEGPRQSCTSVWQDIEQSGKQDEVEATYRSLIDERRFNHFAMYAAGALIGSALLYVLGIVFAWVTRGFRAPDRPE